MDDVEDLELTPALLAFYRSRIHQLQRDQNVALLDRLKQVELSAKQRTLLERELLEYEDELDHSQQDIQDLRNALVRERRAVIELVEENAQLRECYADSSIDSVTPDSNRVASLKRHYDTLLSSLIADHKAYLTRIRLQRDATTVKAQDLISRCARLETSVAEGTRELLRERGEKHALQVRVEEMQTSIEQRITSLRRHLDHSGRGISDNTETTRLKQENEQLRMNMEQFKNRLATQSSVAQDRISILELELHRRKQGVTNTRDHESSLDVNPAFRDRIKQIERLALRYAPLQGPEVDHFFSEIEYAKDVLDGRKPPPKLKRVKSKRKKV